ncbi:hypothetical protein [Herbaspirillum sp. alder98]|uniref:hypothetical protein n=1 Tax=Herbaspirillum sp. alder98 TaxID=2913096 RepID=UPI001CD8648F|nr:hypothetical protein [Herbaspirillum sp. alder98]MCA1323555.1 hypothetical protein [Herbaspirillum sp. alder98]
MPVFTKSLQEKLKTQLLDQSREIMDSTNACGLGEILIKNFPSLSRPMLIDCIPEQGEDIYWVLVSSREIAVVEIPRRKCGAPGDILEIVEVETYRSKRLGRDSRQRLAMALELID